MTILLAILGFSVVLLLAVSAVYFYALSQTRLEAINTLTERLKAQNKELREWQNKTLQKEGFTKLFEQPYEVDPDKVQRPAPKIMTRAELMQRDYDNQVKQGNVKADNAKRVRPQKSAKSGNERVPAPTRVVVEQAKEIIDATK